MLDYVSDPFALQLGDQLGNQITCLSHVYSFTQDVLGRTNWAYLVPSYCLS
jgi:hypothetical protein